MSTILIESKHASFGFDHLYLVYRDNSGNEYIIRGGPEGGVGFGSIEIQSNILLSNSKDARKEETPQDRNSRPINLEGRDAEDVWSIMIQQAQNIQNNTIDYDLDPMQNSNSTIASVLESVGININNNLPLNTELTDLPGVTNLLDVTGSLNGTIEDDIINGGTAVDQLDGGAGEDTLNGGTGNDILIGGDNDNATDTLNGGSDSDTYLFNNNFGSDTINDNGLGNGTTKDIIKINGAILSGEATFAEEKDNGDLTYRLNSHLITISGTTLTIGSGSNKITVNDFTNGDYSLTLGEQPEEEPEEGPSDQEIDDILDQLSLPEETEIPYGSSWEIFKAWLKDQLEQQLQQSLTDSAFNDMLDQMSTAAATQQVVRYDPLVLDLDGDGVELTGINNSNAYFDLDNDSMSEKTGWVSGDDGFLALDKNNNNNIDDISELFGNQNQSGFSELSTYDTNNDNKIDSSDDIYSSLKIWQDRDADGRTDEGELISLSDGGIESINLDTQTQTTLNQNIDGNLIKTIGSYTKTDGTTGQVADIDFNINQSDSQFNGDYNLNINVLFLPFLRGYGDVKALHIAASENTALMDKLTDLANSDLNQFNNLQSKITDIIYEWVEVNDIEGNRGVFSAKKLATLEKFRGEEFRDNWGGTDITNNQLPAINSAWQQLFDSLKTKLLIQSTFKDIFNAKYDLATDSIILNTDLDLEAIKADAEAKLSNITNYKAKIDFAIHLNDILQDKFPDQAGNSLSLAFDNIIDVANQAGDDANGDSGNNLIIGNENSNIINASSGDDALEGNEGDDYLSGDYGNDTYIYNLGDGKDIIGEYNSNSSSNSSYGADKVLFGTGITKDNIFFSKSNNDLVIKFKITDQQGNQSIDINNQITISNQFRSNIDRVETIEFADGSTLDIANYSLLDYEYYGTQGDDTINVYGNSNVNATTGNDAINSSFGNQTYIYNQGDGKDIITDYSGADTIIFDSNISRDDVYFSRGSSTGSATITNDLIIKFRNSDSDQIIITNYFSGQSAGNAYYRVETLEFSDESTIDLSNPANLQYEFSGTDGDDNLSSYHSTIYDDIINSGDGNDYINASSGNDTINAGAGNDTIATSSGNDIINAGTGDDIITGYNYGNDTYIYNLGDGKDIIGEYNSNSSSNSSYGADKVLFGTGITKDNIFFSKSNNDLVIKFKITDQQGNQSIDINNQITISNQFRSNIDRVETIEFADGSTLDIANYSLLDYEYYGTQGDDIITAEAGNDIINSSTGNDNIDGASGNDILNGGEGNDTIYGKNGDDQLNGGLGIDILIGGQGNDSFNFSSLEDSSINAIDYIEDFEQGSDKINLSEIAEDLSFESFEFVVENGHTVIKDKNSDFAIDLQGQFSISEGDFVF